MTAKQTDDRTKTDSLQQMTATYKKNRKIILCGLTILVDHSKCY